LNIWLSWDPAGTGPKLDNEMDGGS